jgi:phage terminase large subunit-like protein
MTLLAAPVATGLDVARWLMATLPSPSDTTRPLVLADAQIDFLMAFYGDGIRRAALQGAKGIGKSPLGAMLGLAELAGPTALPDPLVQIAALSEEQADSTVYSLVLGLIRANDRAVAQRLGIDDGRGRLYLAGRPGKLEAITAAAGSHEGERSTFVVLDETHLWTKQNGGQALARTIRRNVSKSGGRTLELSNAHEPGRGSVAEGTEADYREGRPGILFVARRPSTMPDPAMDDAQLGALIGEVYAGAPWIDQARILAEVRDPATPWSEAARYFLNTPASAADVLVDPSRWAQLALPGQIEDGTKVALGFDGSYSRDGTALVLCTSEGRLSLELLIERDASDPSDWTVPREPVHAVLADLFARFEVVKLLCDPWHWRDEVARWAREYGDQRVLEFPTNSIRRFGPALDRFRTALAEGTVTHGGDPDLARHMANARLVRGPGRAADDGHALYTLEKPGPGRLIDAAVAAVLAYQAMATADPAPRVAPWVEWH